VKESSDGESGETLIAVGVWFQMCGAKSVFVLGTYKRDWLEERSKRLDWW